MSIMLQKPALQSCIVGFLFPVSITIRRPAVLIEGARDFSQPF